MEPSELKTYLTRHRRRIDAALRKALPPAAAKPRTLHEAMRYSLLGGGKRLRPVLCLAAAEACGADPAATLPAACALECVHTYSLIHDDLPCMDDDDLRRGRPTCHKVYGDGIAVLAGDALLTLAFEILAAVPRGKRHGPADLVRELAAAAGSRALIAGQVADLEAEETAPSLNDLQFIHRGKTSAMIACAAVLGAMTADARRERVESLRRFGVNLGLAFQIIDDILDVTQTTEKLGKSAGKDTRDGKATYPALMGLQASRAAAKHATARAIRALKPFGAHAAPLLALSDYLLNRDY